MINENRKVVGTVSDLRNEHKLIDLADIRWRYNPNGKSPKDKNFVFLGDLLNMKAADNCGVKMDEEEKCDV